MYRALASLLVAGLSIYVFYNSSSSATQKMTTNNKEVTCQIDGHYLASHRTILGFPHERTIHIQGERAVIIERRWQETLEEATREGLWQYGVNDTLKLEWKGHNGTIILVNGHFAKDCAQIIVETEAEKGWEIIKINDEEAKLLNKKDSVNEIPNPYNTQLQGKLVFLTGAPGAGKTSIAMWLRDNAEFVFYEGDLFYSGLNPYVIDKDVKIDALKVKQPALIGKGLKTRFDKIIKRTLEPFNDEASEAVSLEFINHLKKERQRIGGDWVIPIILRPEEQAALQSSFGPDMITIVIAIDSQHQQKRLKMRNDDPGYISFVAVSKSHNADDFPMNWDAERTVVLTQKQESSIEENAQKVLSMIQIMKN